MGKNVNKKRKKMKRKEKNPCLLDFESFLHFFVLFSFLPNLFRHVVI